jgi:hypothetical protein
MREPHRTLYITKQGFPDAVVWNPGAEGTRSRADFAANDDITKAADDTAFIDAVDKFITVATQRAGSTPPGNLAASAQLLGDHLFACVCLGGLQAGHFVEFRDSVGGLMQRDAAR